VRGVVVIGLLGACGRLGFDLDVARSGDGSVPGDGSSSSNGDGGSDAASTVCTGFICDDFESALLDARWNISTSQGSGALDTTHAHSGLQSVHLITNAIAVSTTDEYALLHTTMGLPTTGRLYARAWVYLQSPMPTVPIDQIIDFSNFAGQGISACARDGNYVANDYTSTLFAESTTTVILDTWFCLQLEIPSGTSGSTYVSLDDTRLDDLTLTKGSTQPQAQQVFIGTEWPGTETSQAQFEVWIDDVIISTSPTTCEQQ